MPSKVQATRALGLAVIDLRPIQIQTALTIDMIEDAIDPEPTQGLDLGEQLIQLVMLGIDTKTDNMDFSTMKAGCELDAGYQARLGCNLPPPTQAVVIGDRPCHQSTPLHFRQQLFGRAQAIRGPGVHVQIDPHGSIMSQQSHCHGRRWISLVDMTFSGQPRAIRPSERRDAIAEILGHRFNDLDLLALACTHASCLDAQANRETRIARCNERLEFLGDALLDAACAEWLFDRYPNEDEGSLSRYKSRLVSRQILARAMEDVLLLPWCEVGEKMQSPWPDSVKANFAESLLAAVYKDGGWSKLRTAVEYLLSARLEEVVAESQQLDAKGGLQDWCLKKHSCLPSYQTERQGGSDHEPCFCCTVTAGDRQAEGSGSSRRRAETAAAAVFLANLEETER
jgi:ribonuclease III